MLTRSGNSSAASSCSSPNAEPQDVSVPVETSAGGLHVKEQRVLALQVERGWANGTTVKFARRPHDVTGNIVMKLKQVRVPALRLPSPCTREQSHRRFCCAGSPRHFLARPRQLARDR